MLPRQCKNDLFFGLPQAPEQARRRGLWLHLHRRGILGCPKMDTASRLPVQEAVTVACALRLYPSIYSVYMRKNDLGGGGGVRMRMTVFVSRLLALGLKVLRASPGAR